MNNLLNIVNKNFNLSWQLFDIGGKKNYYIFNLSKTILI